MPIAIYCTPAAYGTNHVDCNLDHIVVKTVRLGLDDTDSRYHPPNLGALNASSNSIFLSHFPFSYYTVQSNSYDDPVSRAFRNCAPHKRWLWKSWKVVLGEAKPERTELIHLEIGCSKEKIITNAFQYGRADKVNSQCVLISNSNMSAWFWSNLVYCPPAYGQLGEIG